LIAPVEASREIAILCQNEKNKIPLTQRNLAIHQSSPMGVFRARAKQHTKRPERLEVGADCYPKHSEAASHQHLTARRVKDILER
jgi:hypothetical protein